MKSPYLVIATAITALLLGLEAAAFAQTPPTSLVAPGADVPAYGLPGIGPGNVPVAPGAEAGGINIERIGPGGGLIAPGSAGSASGSPLMGTPVAPSFPSTSSGRIR